MSHHIVLWQGEQYEMVKRAPIIVYDGEQPIGVQQFCWLEKIESAIGSLYKFALIVPDYEVVIQPSNLDYTVSHWSVGRAYGQSELENDNQNPF